MKKNRIYVSKLDAARRQLETAITLYFASADFVSIHALAYAAFNITRSLCDRFDDPESFTSWVNSNVVDSQKKELWQRLSIAGNFFKHADKDPTAVLEYYPDQYELFMIYAVKQFKQATKECPIPFQVFEIWFLLHHPKWLKAKPTQEEIDYIKSGLPEERAEFFDVVSTEFRKRERRRIEQGH